MTRKAQAAMEFLMTYGWAILVVLVVIGALTYFGILNPNTFLPSRCVSGETWLNCKDYQFNSATNTVNLVLENNWQYDIDVTRVDVGEARAGGFSCSYSTLTRVNQGTETSVLPLSGCNPAIQASKKGSKIKGNMSITWKRTDSGVTHTSRGEIIAPVE